MKKRLLVCLVLPVLLLCACDLLPDAPAQARAASETSVWAMNTKMDFRLYGDADGTAAAALFATVNRLDRALSATAEDSALTALNRSGSTDDAEIAALADEAGAVSARTGGALDITLLPVSRAWGFGTGAYRVVPADELAALRDRVGMDKLTRSGGTLTLPAGTELDFGALAKGYAADLCRAELEARGISGLLSLGGNIQTVGTKPDGSDWLIGVQDPDDAGRFVLTLRLTGSKAAVSSGDYQRFFERDGVRYCHILDPKTLAPVRGTLRAVTVVTDRGLYADALSTALFVLGREAGTEFWRQQRDFEAVWLEADGTVWVTAGLADRVTEGSFEVIAP